MAETIEGEYIRVENDEVVVIVLKKTDNSDRNAIVEAIEVPSDEV